MKPKKLKNGVTVFTTDEMYESIKRISDEQEISLGQLIREAIDAYLSNQPKIETK